MSLSETPSTALVCARCGTEMMCGAHQGQSTCWCTELVISPRLMDELKAAYQGCLCAPCLDLLGTVRRPLQP